jgi:uncharacterized protein YbjT (DUF2867 family)
MSALPPAAGSREPCIFVAGATGYTGRAVVSALRSRGLVTWAHVRPDSRNLMAWRDRFAAQGAGVDATAWAPDAMRATLARIQPTHVFALLGTTKARFDRDTGSAVPESYEAVDYGLSHLLLDAARAVDAAPAFIYLSALGSDERSGSEYLAVRGRIEREVQASALPWLIVRPSFITGPDRGETRTVERTLATATDLLLGIVGAFGVRGVVNRWKSISGPELGEGLARLAVDAAPRNRIVDGRDLWRALRGPRA